MVANFVLTDEINRAPAKVQSALLEVMAERHVSIGGKTFPMPDPFLVMATQNPIENEGVYPLPEAQRDRFLFKLLVGYPEPDEEREIVYRMGVIPPVANQVLPIAELSRLQQVAAERLRPPRAGRLRGPAGLRHPHPGRARADRGRRLAVLRRIARAPRSASSPPPGRWRWSAGGTSSSRRTSSTSPPDVLRHRLVLSYDALADGIPVEMILGRLLQAIPLPQVSPYTHPGPPDGAAPVPRARRSTAALARAEHRRPGPAGRRPGHPGADRRGAGWTGCCRATTSAWCPAPAPNRATPGRTTPATTSGGWTGR